MSRSERLAVGEVLAGCKGLVPTEPKAAVKRASKRAPDLPVEPSS